jgi:hypothetical protein
MWAVLPRIKKVVTSVVVQNPSGNLECPGTGFLVSVVDETDGERVHGYLVTARHVMCDSENRYYPTIFVTLNKIRGVQEILSIPLSGEGASPVHTHDDTTVDIAVVPLPLRKDITDHAMIEADAIPTREAFGEMGINEGDEIFYVELYAPVANKRPTLPIVRFGRVAMFPEEAIPWGPDKPTLYLAECWSFEGNSGCPVFLDTQPTRETQSSITRPSKLALAGIMKGVTREEGKIQLTDKRQDVVVTENAGIAAIVPSYQLNEILFSDQLRKTRTSAS